MPHDPHDLRSRIRQILLEEWDPHNASRNDAARHTYDHYIDPLIELIHSGGDEQAVIDFLHERETETMCFPSLGTQRLRRPAQQLLAAVRGH